MLGERKWKRSTVCLSRLCYVTSNLQIHLGYLHFGLCTGTGGFSCQPNVTQNNCEIPFSPNFWTITKEIHFPSIGPNPDLPIGWAHCSYRGLVCHLLWPQSAAQKHEFLLSKNRQGPESPDLHSMGEENEAGLRLEPELFHHVLHQCFNHAWCNSSCRWANILMCN